MTPRCASWRIVSCSTVSIEHEIKSCAISGLSGTSSLDNVAVLFATRYATNSKVSSRDAMAGSGIVNKSNFQIAGLIEQSCHL